MGQQPLSRSGSARSFNTTFGRPAATPSPGPQRAHLGGPQSLGGRREAPSPSPQSRQQDFLRQQAEYRAQQMREHREQQLRDHEQRELQNQLMQQEHEGVSNVKNTVRDIIANTDFGSLEKNGGSPSLGPSRVIQVDPRPDLIFLKSRNLYYL